MTAAYITLKQSGRAPWRLTKESFFMEIILFHLMIFVLGLIEIKHDIRKPVFCSLHEDHKSGTAGFQYSSLTQLLTAVRQVPSDLCLTSRCAIFLQGLVLNERVV